MFSRSRAGGCENIRERCILCNLNRALVSESENRKVIIQPQFDSLELHLTIARIAFPVTVVSRSSRASQRDSDPSQNQAALDVCRLDEVISS